MHGEGKLPVVILTIFEATPADTDSSLFALELQIKFITLAAEPLQSALPVGSDVVSDTREQIAQTACVMSRCLARDVEILRML